MEPTDWMELIYTHTTIILVILLLIRILMAGWCAIKIDGISDLKGGNIRMFGWTFVCVLIFGVLGMVACAVMCAAIPNKGRIREE